MSLYTERRSSLRQSLAKTILRRSLMIIRRDRLRGRYLFRSAVRRVLLYMEWITEVPVTEEITDDVTINIRMALRKVKEKKRLTLEDRSILLVNPLERSTSDIKYIYDLFDKMQAFSKYPEDVRRRLASACMYQYLPAGRVIVRQGHKARNLYFIAHGEVDLSKVVIEQFTEEEKIIDMGILETGDMFGEVALFHRIPRSATVVSKTSIDLLLVPDDDFDIILRETLTQKWDVLRDALVHFDYFKWWDEVTVRECCILSKLKDFKSNEVLLGDGEGMVNYVYFILSGECRLIEHLLIRERPPYDGTKFELFDSEKNRPQKKKPEEVSKKTVKSDEPFDMDFKTTQQADNADDDRLSIVTTTLLDVIRAWHEITDVAAMLMRKPSVTPELRYPKEVRTVFMQVCIFSRGACFGLGENMMDRRIVAITSMRCFLVPRYWLLEHNRANIWGRVMLFLDSKYPTKKQLFDEFILNRNWMTYKQNLMKDVIVRRGRYRSNTTIHDVPYSIRIREEINESI